MVTRLSVEPVPTRMVLLQKVRYNVGCDSFHVRFCVQRLSAHRPFHPLPPLGITYPSSAMQAQLMQEVLDRSKIRPSDIRYHEAHGTGTIAGDREELAALAQVHKPGLQIGSVKSNMGHAEGASGLMGLIKILLMYEDKMLYPNFGFQDSPHDAIRQGQFTVVQKCQDWEPTPASISNFGFGGSNVFAVVKPCPDRKRLPVATAASAAFCSNGGLEAPPSQYEAYYSLHRALGNHYAFSYEWKNQAWKEQSPLVYVCNGQGSQWNTMGQDLMQTSPVFRETMERLDRESGIPLVQLYQDGTQWMKKQNTVIGIVSYQLGLIAILESQGIQPDLFLGHSLGELVCAYLAGLQTDVEVLRAAQVRSELANLIDKDARIDIYETEPADGYDFLLGNGSTTEYGKQVPSTTPLSPNVVRHFDMKGKMVVAGCEAHIIEKLIEDNQLTQTCVACYNAPKGQTISGPAAEVQ